MTQQFMNSTRLDTGIGATSARGRPDGRGRVMLIAVPPELMPPVSFGSALFQHIRVVLVHEDETDDFEPSNVLGELPQLGAPAAMASSSANALRHSRRLRGEILCDESGRLFERIGNYVHPVHQLVAGPHGEVLDLPPPPSRPDFRRGAPVIDVEADDAPRPLDRRSAREPMEVSTADIDEPAAPAMSCRELVPASVRPRVVQLGPFREVLGPQLLHPERLRDQHRLRCRVRVYEATRAQRVDTLRTELFKGAGGQLLPLTGALAARLELTDLISHPRTAAMHHEPGLVFPGERLVKLEVIEDPTAVVSPPRSDTRAPAVTEAPAAPLPVVAAPDPPSEMRPVNLPKKTIPDRFLGPWQFTMTREEAMYDLDAGRTKSPLARVIARVRARLTSRGDFHKWQILLAGKNLEDQLWAVRPPRGGLSNDAVRRWARLTIEATGYDADATMLEWEIFWRRRGL